MRDRSRIIADIPAIDDDGETCPIDNAIHLDYDTIKRYIEDLLDEVESEVNDIKELMSIGGINNLEDITTAHGKIEELSSKLY